MDTSTDYSSNYNSYSNIDSSSEKSEDDHELFKSTNFDRNNCEYSDDSSSESDKSSSESDDRLSNKSLTFADSDEYKLNKSQSFHNLSTEMTAIDFTIDDEIKKKSINYDITSKYTILIYVISGFALGVVFGFCLRKK